jgi:hypothetical protein
MNDSTWQKYFIVTVEDQICRFIDMPVGLCFEMNPWDDMWVFSFWLDQALINQININPNVLKYMPEMDFLAMASKIGDFFIYELQTRILGRKPGIHFNPLVVKQIMALGD